MSNTMDVPWRGPRKVINLFSAPYDEYDLEGEPQNDIKLLNISYDNGMVRHANGARFRIYPS